MVIEKNSIEIIDEFLKLLGIPVNPQSYLDKLIIKSDKAYPLPKDIIPKIIADAYGLSDQAVKNISNSIQKELNIYLGRIQKNQLKKYIDYGFESDFYIFKNLIGQEVDKNFNLKEYCDRLIDKEGLDFKKTVDLFKRNISEAMDKGDEKRVRDYLIFLYSRLLSLNENRKISLKSIFDENRGFIKKEMPEEDYLRIQEFCSNTECLDREKVISKFNKEYIRILEHNGGYKDKNSIVYLKVNQNLLDQFNNNEEFFSFLLEFVKMAYEKTQNHKSLLIDVESIFDNKGGNLKWKIYSYLTIFAENFIKDKENRAYYIPSVICQDYLKYKYNIILSDNDLKTLDYYFNEKADIFPEKLNEFRKEIDSFRYIHRGFTFVDCLILNDETSRQDSSELSFIKDKTRLLLIFHKNEIDDRKVPCPVCASLKISGNSYPELGIRSWECKNPLCSARSKTNRGKRYSQRTILMQDATFDFSDENQISKELTKIWRKDVVEKWNNNLLYEMIIKYFSYVGDSILLVNLENYALFQEIAENQKRVIKKFDVSKFITECEDKTTFKEFMGDEYFNRFLFKKEDPNSITKTLNIEEMGCANIILGDAFISLSSFKDNSIHNMVTSPPYYNAREYSQWSNLHHYLHDMYNIVSKCKDKLISGGVFLYNIGDIFDNDKLVVKSKMGDKRIPLGAYTIFIFEKAGFNILDNLIWYKGEPQSNRHKNDGNYSPYYQRPANCYEHMFIFKTPGKLHLNELKNIKTNSNIIKFTPVFKIGRGGENRYGHTAPYPLKIPEISLNCFSKKGELIFDPFLGSGTSVIAACNNERKGMGVEMNEEYFSLCENRIKESGFNVKKII